MISTANQESLNQANDQQLSRESRDVRVESLPHEPATQRKPRTQIITSKEDGILKIDIPAANPGMQVTENPDAETEDNPLNNLPQKPEDSTDNAKAFDENHMTSSSESQTVSNMASSSDVEEAIKSSQIKVDHGSKTSISPSESRRRGGTLGSSPDPRLPIAARRRSETIKTSKQPIPSTSRRDSQSRLAAAKAVANSHHSVELEHELVKKIQDLQNQMQQVKSERDQAMSDKGQVEAEKEKAKVEKEKLRKERDAAIAERDRARLEKRNLKIEKDKAESERNQAKSDRKGANVERDKVRREKDAAISQKGLVSTERDRAKAEAKEAKAELEKLKSERDNAVTAKEKAEAERDQFKTDRERTKSERIEAKENKKKLREIRDTALATIQLLEAERDQIISERDQAIFEITDAKTAKEKAELERDEAKVEGQQHLQNFTEVQNQIFSMQPRRPDIMEEEAINSYNSLCSNVGDWIDSQLDDVLDRDCEVFSQTNVDLDSGSRLLRLISMTPGAMKRIEVPGTLQYYLQNAFMNFIRYEIFKPEPFGVDGGPWKLLHIIESNMRALDPHRDEAAIRAWRSETLLALYTSAEYINERYQLVNMLVVSLFECLQVLLPETSKEDRESLLKSLAQKIIIPAIDLSEKFHISAKIFGFFRHGAPDSHHKNRPELERYNFKNLHDSGRAVKAFQQGFEYYYITDISLGLYCRTIKGDTISTKQYLRNAEVLLAVQKPDMSYAMQKDTALGHIHKCIEAHNAYAQEMAKLDIKPKCERSFFKSIFPD